MLKVDISLNEVEEGSGLYSPTIMVTEDTSDETCPIIFPESINEEAAVRLTKTVKEVILANCQTVADVNSVVYGEK